MDESLMCLAGAAGIEPGYWDGLGTRRDLTPATARALLRSLGFDPDVEVEAQARLLEERPFSLCLPPVLCVTAGAPLAVEVSLAPTEAGQPLAWRIEFEVGTEATGLARPEFIGSLGLRPLGGAERGRYHLSLPLPAPLTAGYHRFSLPALDAACTLIAAPDRCFISPLLAAGGRYWGLAVQLYAVRSGRNWGIGDFTDLARIAAIAGRAGAALIGLNPLHARHLARPDEASPYAPSSRFALDPMYLDVEAVADFADSAAAQAMVHETAFQARLERARQVDLVDHAGVVALKLPVLRSLFETFRARLAMPDDPRAADYRAFVRSEGTELERHATFEALRLWLEERDGMLTRWRDWPAELRDPETPAVRAFRASHAAEIEFHHYLQWQADLQLRAAADAARAAGMPIGLYRDLAVGAADDGAECWGAGDLIARGASVGAPPDLLNRDGQDWGLPPWNPRVLEARAYAPLGALLAANMRHAGALRIDHVMALTRLFWIPAGMKGDAGGYVRYAQAAMAGVVALESVRHQCHVIGEDLGSVPAGLRESLAARGLLSYRVLLFERDWDGDGSFKRPWEYPHQALAMVVTHDMATIAEFWQGGDIERRARLGLFPDVALEQAEGARRASDRERLLALLDELGLEPTEIVAESITAALHATVARSSAMLAMIQFDDISGEIEPINIPGTHREYPNWRRKVSLSTEEIEQDPRWRALIAAMRAAGRISADSP